MEDFFGSRNKTATLKGKEKTRSDIAEKDIPSRQKTDVPEENPHQKEIQQDPHAEASQTKTKTLCNPVKDIARGSIFAGRYQIIEELGIGGRGRVYKAYDLDLEEKVALKLINPEIAADENTIKRFRNELKIARKIVHKNVCRMFDLGKYGENYYITMEYVSGEDLKSTVRRVGPLSPGKAIFIAKRVCQGLAEAHRLGIVHRDLKPQNIMIDREGNVRVMDFGIARYTKAKGLTEDGQVIGTPEYMSPEQVEGREADKRTDIYSMGVILYEMVTGHVPFDGLTPMSVASKHLTKRPKEPREFNAQIPDKLSKVIMRCMEKERGRRYQNIEELLLSLTEIERGIPSTDTIKPERKPITSKEITISFNLRRLLIPVSLLIVVIMIGVIAWQLVLNPKTKKEPVSSIPSKTEVLNAAQKYLEDEDYVGAYESFKKILEIEPENFEAQFNMAMISMKQGKTEQAIEEFEKAVDLDDTDPRSFKQLAKIFEGKKDLKRAVHYYKKYLSTAPENSDLDETKKITAILEAKLRPAKKQEAPVIKTSSKEKDQRKMDIMAKLDEGIESFNQGHYEQCIQQMEEVLRNDAGNESAQYYLAEAKKRNEIKITQEEIANRIHLAEAAYQKGDYQECLLQSKNVLSLDPKNLEAKKYLDLANIKIIPGEIGNLIHMYIQALKDNTLISFYQKRCTTILYQKMRKEVESIITQYDQFESQASDITLRFKDNDQMEVRFFNITTGVSKKDKSRQVIFEGIYFWELEKQEDEWKIIGIKIQSPDRFQLESHLVEP